VDDAAPLEVEEHAPAEPRGGEVRRVLLVTPRLLDTRGGRATTDLALRLDRSRFEPAVCCYDGWGPLAEELMRAGIEIFPLRRRSGLDVTFPLALASEIRSRRIDVVHSLNARRAYLVGALGGLFAGSQTSVATLRDTRLLSESRRLAWLGRMCGEMVRAVVATSEEVREELERERWVPPGKTVVIRDGVNLARFDLQGAEAPARAHWGVAEDAPLVGAVLQGRGSEELALLFDAFGRVRREEPHARLLIAGIGLTGAIPDGALGVGAYGDSPAFYAAIDVLCVPLATRAVPLTLLEGLAAGVPIAASLRPLDEGLAPEGPWAFANVTPPGAQRLAMGILELLREPDEARALARAGRSCVEADHSIDANVASIQALYG
jgi:glycosyltransferase involved in cell wall biosynthesis